MQIQDLHYRNEIKQLLTITQYHLLQTLLKPIMIRDSHASSNGSYAIRSIYFDDIFDSALNEKRAGIADRKKYRIRFYDLSDHIIHLECKIKFGTKITKVAVPITRACAEQMLRGDYSLLEQIPHPLAQEVCCLARTKLLQPKIVVDYVREAYCSPLSNIRLTFDQELTAGELTPGLFDTDGRSMRVLPQQMIFEIKYDTFLPAHIQQILSHVNGKRTALSKYVMCRDQLAILLGNEKYGGIHYERNQININ